MLIKTRKIYWTSECFQYLILSLTAFRKGKKKKGLPQQTSDNDSVTRNETSGQLLHKTGKAGDYQPLDLRDGEKRAL